MTHNGKYSSCAVALCLQVFRGFQGARAPSWSHTSKVGHILRAQTIKALCTNSSSNYHTVIQNGTWKLATKWKLFHTLKAGHIFWQHLGITTTKKLETDTFSPVHAVFDPFYMVFLYFSSRVSFILHFVWASMWGKTQNHWTEEKHNCNATKIGWCSTWSYLII